MNKLLLSLGLGLCVSAAFALPGGNPAKGHKALRVGSTAVQRALTRAVLPVQTLRISNIPGRPAIHVGLQAPLAAHTQPVVRLVSRQKVYRMLFPKNPVPDKMSAGKMFVPQGLLGPQKAVYRGMSLNLAELKNLFVNGLEPHKSIAHRKVYTALAPTIALAYANPAGHYIAGREKKHDLPVLVKIPFTPQLQQYAGHMRQDIKNGNIVFDQDLPARCISAIWVFLEVNGRPDWYKAVWEQDELLLLPAPGELRTVAEGLNVWEYEPGPDD